LNKPSTKTKVAALEGAAPTQAARTSYVAFDRPSRHAVQGQRARITGSGTCVSEGRRSAL